MATEEELLVRAAIRDDLSAPLDTIRRRLDDVGDEAERAGRRATLGARGFDRLVRGGGTLARFLGRTLVTAARAGVTALGLIGAAAGILSYKLLQLSSDAAETASAFATVFGKNAKTVDRWVQRTRAQFGITTNDLQQAATTFGVFGKAAGIPERNLSKFTTQLAQAGLDLSSFYNADPTEVFEALRSGLAGEAEPLRRFGIFLSDATLQAKAAQLGLTGELTESQKVMVRQAIILESLGDAHGDLARTSEGYANQQRALTGRIVEFGTRIGDLIKIAALPLVRVLNDRLAPVVNRLTDFTDRYVAAVEKAGPRSRPALRAFDELGHSGARLRRIYLGVLNAADAYKAGGLDGLVASIDRQLGANGKLVDVYEEVKSILDDVGTVFRDLVLPVVADLEDALPAILTPLGLLRETLGFVADNSEQLVPFVEALVAGYLAYVTAAKAAAVGTALITGAQALYATGLVVTTTAEGAATTGAWSLNAALAANPVGLVVAAIALLVAGLVLAYKKSDTFRGIVDTLGDGLGWLWHNILEPVGEFIGKTLVGYLKLVGNVWLTFYELVVRAAGFFVGVILDGFGIIVHAAASAFGWIPGIGDDVNNAAAAFDSFTAGVKDQFDAVADKIHDTRDALNNLGKDPVDVVVYYHVARATQRRVDDQLARGGGSPYAGDTAHSRAGGWSTFDRTMAAHVRYASTGQRITNAFVGGGGRGYGSGDHQAGRALDVAGPNLLRYKRRVELDGGFAQLHGSGDGRHLHAVPAGDTATSRSGHAAATVTVAPGAVVIDARGLEPAAVGDAVREGLTDAIVDATERSYD